MNSINFLDKPPSKSKMVRVRGQLGELILVGIVIAVVVMMIVPLQQWLLDLLISVNLALSLLVFSLSLFIKRPLQFSAFPTVLLIATLYRLALNVASTRLILTQADAGDIIGAFGGFVVGGDILVGAVIFGILAMVLFLVITKGAQRVAEVAARFTLDALPGMQMAIDADLKAGTISPRELSKRRSDLEQQSHYYGSLDGAMKFVRGDAVAGLIIIAVNIVGGIAIGMLRHNLSVTQALDTYGRLTVGDGLVTMIPALLVSTAAGLLITRVSQGDNSIRLGQMLKKQLLLEPRALATAALLLLILATVPMLPAWPFVFLAGILGVLGAWGFVKERQQMREVKASHAPMGAPLGLDETQLIVDKIAQTRPVLVRETVPKLISLAVFKELLSMMDKDGLSLEHAPELLEAVALERPGQQPIVLFEKTRRRMSQVITASLVQNTDKISVAIMSPDMESVIETGLTQTEAGPALALPGEVLNEIKQALKNSLTQLHLPVLLVKPSLRLHLSNLLNKGSLAVNVIAHGELLPHINCEIKEIIDV